MFGAMDSNLLVCEFGLMVVAVLLLWRLIAWVREAPIRADPWDAEVAQQLLNPEIQEICPHCSTPQPPGAWFCEHCGRAVGPYNNWMPYLNCFSEGEVFRNGMDGRFKHRGLIFAGLILLALSAYSVFTPVYLFCVIRKWRLKTDAAESADKSIAR
jgi:hypothetical protein